jgi:hypothetical protein
VSSSGNAAFSSVSDEFPKTTVSSSSSSAKVQENSEVSEDDSHHSPRARAKTDLDQIVAFLAPAPRHAWEIATALDLSAEMVGQVLRQHPDRFIHVSMPDGGSGWACPVDDLPPCLEALTDPDESDPLGAHDVEDDEGDADEWTDGD